MNPSGHQPDLLQSSPASAVNTPDEVRGLRGLLNAALAGVLLLSLAVNLFLFKQMRLMRSKVSESQPLVQRMSADFVKKEPSMRNFVSSLQSFAMTHPDFLPVLSKYTNALPQFFSNPVRIGATMPRVAAPSTVAPPPAKPPGK